VFLESYHDRSAAPITDNVADPEARVYRLLLTDDVNESG